MFVAPQVHTDQFDNAFSFSYVPNQLRLINLGEAQSPTKINVGTILLTINSQNTLQFTCLIGLHAFVFIFIWIAPSIETK